MYATYARSYKYRKELISKSTSNRLFKKLNYRSSVINRTCRASLKESMGDCRVEIYQIEKNI